MKDKDKVVCVVCKAALMVIGPILENEFLDMSHGFRPGHGVTEGQREVSEYIDQGHTHVMDADIRGYFDDFARDELMARVVEHIADGQVLGLPQGWPDQDIMMEMDLLKPTAGLHGGAAVSPLPVYIIFTFFGLSDNS